ncbi:MAG: DUF5695 domain-containing protein [Candidatus Methanomethyliaceae archaeon]
MARFCAPLTFCKKKGKMYMKCEIEGRQLSVTFDCDEGRIWAIQDKTGLNFVGNEENISDTSFLAAPLWLGDIVLQIWNGRGWEKVTTRALGDIRIVEVHRDVRRVHIGYAGRGKKQKFDKIELRETFEVTTDDSLLWEVKVENRCSEEVEIGEISFPFVMNTDYAELFRGPRKLDDEAERQKRWHEHKVMCHFFISGCSSYALLVRPAGISPYLLFHTLGDTQLECVYKCGNAEGSQWDVIWEGPYLLSAHSWALKQRRSWHCGKEPQRFWINGHSYCLLKPGEVRTFKFRFTLLTEYKQVESELYQNGQVSFRVHPSMVLPVGRYAYLRLKTKYEPLLWPKSSGIDITLTESKDDCYYYNLKFKTPGQKLIWVSYAGTRWMNLAFYALPGDIGKLLKDRAQFIVEKQYYDNPHDQFGRHHCFLPYDNVFDSVITESDEAWQVGGSDEYCLPPAMYVAEKNVYYPDPEQVKVLEEYIDEFLLGCLQSPETWEVKRGLYWFEEHPSREEMQWNRDKATSTSRTFNYPLVANIYYAMYRIGKLHGLVTRRTPDQYLHLCWQTVMKWLETGEHVYFGAPAGSTIVDILKTMGEEAPHLYNQLLARVLRVNTVFEEVPYPLGSELYVDQTGHDQVYTLLKFFGKKAKAHLILQTLKALRAGQQGFWFWYGNEKRGNVTCWYAQTQNSRCLLDGYEDTGDIEMLMWGYAGLLSFLTTLRVDGTARGWFLWWPEHFGFDSRTLDTDLGLYGYLRAAKAFVVTDAEWGLVGYGCDVERSNIHRDCFNIIPWDGLRKRLNIVPLGVQITVDKGELKFIEVDMMKGRLLLELEDSTGFVDEFSFRVEKVNRATGENYGASLKVPLVSGVKQSVIIVDLGNLPALSKVSEA